MLSAFVSSGVTFFCVRVSVYMNVCVHLCMCLIMPVLLCVHLCIPLYVLVKMCVRMYMCVTCIWACAVCACVCVSFLWPGEKVMQDDEFTCDLFRFLQLLCEGHNSGVHKFSTVNFTGKWLNILICENLPVLSQKHFHCLWLDR